MSINGILIINKEKEWTSNDVVQKVKHLVNEKVGHTGTLDPMATGVLPLLIGKGTLCAKYLVNHDKKYQATIQLGIKTDSADIEGNILEKKEVNSAIFENVQNVLEEFKGKQKQTPPKYSAIKIKGKKLYEYARKGQEVEIPEREIEIYNIKLLNVDKKEEQINFEVQCSKGTYIRSLCEDIAEKLGTIGFMKELNRTQVGDFYIENSIKINELIEKNELIAPSYISIEEFFKNKEKIELNEKAFQLFLNGVKLNNNKEDGVYRIYNNNKFIGTGIIKNKLLKRDVII